MKVEEGGGRSEGRGIAEEAELGIGWDLDVYLGRSRSR